MVMTRVLPFLALLILTGCPRPDWTGGEASPHVPLLHRLGSAFRLTIDGQPVVPTGPREVIDIEGDRADTVHWMAETDGSLCLRLDIAPDDDRLGRVRGIDVLVKEAPRDLPFDQWRLISLDPDPARGSLQPGSEWCPTQFVEWASGSTQPKLGPGRYILTVTVWGKRNWDRKMILLLRE